MLEYYATHNGDVVDCLGHVSLNTLMLDFRPSQADLPDRPPSDRLPLTGQPMIHTPGTPYLAYRLPRDPPLVDIHLADLSQADLLLADLSLADLSLADPPPGRPLPDTLFTDRPPMAHHPLANSPDRSPSGKQPHYRYTVERNTIMWKVSTTWTQCGHNAGTM